MIYWVFVFCFFLVSEDTHCDIMLVWIQATLDSQSKVGKICYKRACCCSVAESRLTLQPNGLQHARLPCPSLPPGVCSKLMSIESMMPSHHLIPCCSFLLLPSILPSIRVFSNELTLCIRWPKYWSISFSISPSNEYSSFISLKIDWFDLLAAQGTLKSLWLQYLSQSWSFRRSGHNYVEAKTLGESVLWSFDPIFLFPMTEFWMNTTKRQWYSNIWPQDPFTVLRLSKSHLKSFWLDEWYLSTFIIFFIKLETV